MEPKTGVILIGHGAAPSDFPRELTAELKGLEGARMARGGVNAPMSPREAELDRKVRTWPRSPKNDPYQAGLQEVAAKLKPFLASARLEIAFNEFCAPSIEDAAEALVKDGCARISLATIMTTRGGVHSELEIPEIARKLQELHPGVRFVYAWPYDPVQVAELIARNLNRF